MTTSVNQYQPVENQNGLDLPLIIRGSYDHALLGPPSKSNTYGLSLRCFLFYARKTPGFGGVWRICAEIVCGGVRLFLNELIISFDLIPFQALINGRSSILPKTLILNRPV
jgi:hypothetical protein